MIELYIDNKLVELSDSIDYSLTKSFFDLSDPSKLCDDWSKTIKIPMTESNRKLFGQWQIPNRATTDGNSLTGIEFSPYTKVGYSLFDNGARIMEGHIKMNKTVYSQKDKNFEITLYGNWNESLHQLQAAEGSDVISKVYVNNDNFQMSKLTTNSSNNNLSSFDNSFRVFPNTVGNYYPEFNSDECLLLQNKTKYSYDRELPILSTKEFRIDKLPLYKSVQSIFGEISKYTKNFILDPLFFSKGNPYFTKTWWQVSSPFMNYSAESTDVLGTTDKMKVYSSSVITTKESIEANTSPAMVGIPVYNGDDVAIVINPTGDRFEFKYREPGNYMVGTSKINLTINNIYTDDTRGGAVHKVAVIATGNQDQGNLYNFYSLTSGTFIRVHMKTKQVTNNSESSNEDTVKTYSLCMKGDKDNCAIPEGDVIIEFNPARMDYTWFETVIYDYQGSNKWYVAYKGTNSITFEADAVEPAENMWALKQIFDNPDQTNVRVYYSVRKGNNGDNNSFLVTTPLQGLPANQVEARRPNWTNYPQAQLPAGSMIAKFFNTFYLNKSAKVEKLFGNFNYFEFLCNYAKMFNLKLLTKDGYNILTMNNRLLGYDINLDTYPIDYNEEYAGVKIDYSSIEYSPIWLESTYLELTYAENDLSFGKRFLDENNKQYGAFVEKSSNEFAVERTPIYESPLMPAITTDVNSLEYPRYKMKSDNADDGLILDGSDNGMTPIRLINMGNTDGETITDGMSMVFESENVHTIPHSFWSVSTPEMINNQDYCYYRKISETNENVAKKYLMKDTYTFYNWNSNGMSITSKFAKEEYQGNSILFNPTQTKYYTNYPLREYGLKEKFHRYLDDLYTTNSRMMKCKAIVDMSKFEWYHLMVIDGCNWLVTKINNWKNSESLCDLELVKVENIDKYKNYTYGFDQFDLQWQNVKGKANEEFMVVCSHDANDTEIEVMTNADKITLIEQTQLFNDLCVYKYKINADATEDYTIDIDSVSGETTHINVKKV